MDYFLSLSAPYVGLGCRAYAVRLALSDPIRRGGSVDLPDRPPAGPTHRRGLVRQGASAGGRPGAIAYAIEPPPKRGLRVRCFSDTVA